VVARSTLGEVANPTSDLLATCALRSEPAIGNGGLLRTACMVREKQSPWVNSFKTTPFGELVFKSAPSGEICLMGIQ